MERELLENYIEKGLSIRQIAKEIGKAQTTIRHWLKKYDLKTNHGILQNIQYGEYRYCPRCKKECLTSEFYQRTSTRLAAYCKKCANNITTERMIKFKLKCIEYKGGKCIICEYNKYYGSLEFHHLDPKEKEYTISHLRSNGFNDKVRQELDKCILLCSNCHKEVEGGIIIIKNGML